MSESLRKLHFHYLVITALVPILRFPRSFGCSQELVDITRAKCNVALELVMTNSHSLQLLPASVFQDLLQCAITAASQCGGLIDSLCQMQTKVIATLNSSVLLQAWPYITSTGLSHLRYLYLLERMCEECSRGAEFSRLGVTKLLSQVIRSHNSTADIKSQAFRVLIQITYQLYTNSDLIEIMVKEDLFVTLRAFFDDPAFVRQEEIDKCIMSLSYLRDTHAPAIADSGVIQSLIDWARRYWRNSELIRNHRDTLAILASQFSAKLEFGEDTSWFKPMRSYLSSVEISKLIFFLLLFSVSVIEARTTGTRSLRLTLLRGYRGKEKDGNSWYTSAKMPTRATKGAEALTLEQRRRKAQGFKVPHLEHPRRYVQWHSDMK